ncbi:28S ribosomal protein S22, mitochondrial-like [Stylophora pistillata]|nr:28S ribosomal protein S22, mitochondrial-like [Stylophora pistillata]
MAAKIAASCGQFRAVKFPFRWLVLRTFCSGEAFENKGNTTSFFNPEIQSLLKKLTGRNLDKIYAVRKGELEVPSYKLMTDAEYLEVQRKNEEEAEAMLEMPPVMDEREEIDEIIEENEELAQFSESNYVFTDISTSESDRTRSITVREPRGRLRKAVWDERDRLNFIYFPKPGRQYEIPELLTDEGMQTVFQQNRHEDVLDLACVQFEPDSADYIRIHHRTYEDLLKSKKYDILRSTRHYGGLLYYLATQQKINQLLNDMMDMEQWDDCVDLAKLYILCHPKDEIATRSEKNNLIGFSLLRAFLRECATQEMLKKLEDHMEHLTEEQNMGTSSNSVN